MIVLNNLLSRRWNIFQKTLFSPGCGLSFSFHIGISYLKARRCPVKGPGGKALRRVRGGQPQLHPPTPCNWADLDS